MDMNDRLAVIAARRAAVTRANEGRLALVAARKGGEDPQLAVDRAVVAARLAAHQADR